MTDSLDGKTFEAGSASARDAYSLAAGSSLGQYRILRPLGRGGMGEVYEAEHRVLARRYALKVLPADFASRPGAVERFEREARVMSNLEHANIVRVDDFGDTDGRYWLRMELAEGVQIEGRLVVSTTELVEARGGKLGQEEWLGLLEQIIQGLGYAHGRGAIHRDLKASNILLAPGSDGKPVAKIADFGLVRIVGEEWVRKSAELSLSQSMSIGPAATTGGDEQGTSTHALLGTYEYMSPEQKEGGEADERSDIYALGLMTFRILTGQKTLGFRLPSALDSRLVPAWDDLIAQSLEPDRDERLGDCEAVRTLLAEVRGQIGQKALEAEERNRREREEAEHRRHAQEEIARQRRAEEARRRREAAEAEEPAERRGRWGLPVDLEAIYGAMLAPLDGLASGSVEAQKLQREFSERTGLPLEIETCQTQIRMRLVPPGTFLMGSPDGESGRFSSEGPQHDVTISSGLYVGKFEVTQGQWEAVMGTNPSHFKAAGRDAPVENVSWHDCQEFLRKLCEREGVPAGTYRLLTEAEWEYACRAGTRTGLYTGPLTIRGENHGPELDAIAWYGGNSGVSYEGGYDSSGWPQKQYGHNRAGTHPVGQKVPNAWGLHDMIGNVWEWVQDDWHGSYEGAPRDGSARQASPSSGSDRVCRGGSWFCYAWLCRLAFRLWFVPGDPIYGLGFRLARQLPPSGR